MSGDSKYSRVLLKLSGEALMGDKPFGIDTDKVEVIGAEIKRVVDQGVEVALVIGAGNIFRGVSEAAEKIERASADHMGMLATIMNALAVQSILEGMGLPTVVQSAIPMPTVCEPFQRRTALDHLNAKKVMIFAAGTGSPYFTTDTGAALRAIEMGCDALMKGTQVDGVYTADPKKDPTATRYDTLSFQEVLAKDLRVMDAAAIALCRDNAMPILVFSIHEPGAFADVVNGQGFCTTVK